MNRKVNQGQRVQEPVETRDGRDDEQQAVPPPAQTRQGGEERNLENLMLREQIDTALKTAMKAKDAKDRVATLRLINAAIKDRDIAARGEDRCEGVTDEEILALLTKMVKQREESAAAFEKGCRPELAEQERGEIEVIREFLPRQLDQQEIEAAVADVIKEFEAEGLKDMGRCMGALKERYNGAMDFGRAGQVMKKSLS